MTQPSQAARDAAELIVTQADREAAARAGLDMARINERDANALRQGGAWDEWTLVQAFARHRTVATAAKDAEIERLKDALHDAVCIIGHAVPMDTTVLAGQRLVARDVWQAGYDILNPSKGAK